ncbi:MAG TPA: antitoxin Xre/MbcA/ParS toxin-binding domain-containing protein [Gemmatimonadaceae bacterium]|nr:antitoxin Xre/MbcA/ParS toxin-binding domain-containing protein [Gemmatimonadaceae bacterium]
MPKRPRAARSTVKSSSKRSARRPAAEHPHATRVAEAAPVASGTWWNPVLHGERSFARVASVSPMTRVALVEHGVPSEALDALGGEMMVPLKDIYAMLGIPPATAARKARKGERLNMAASDAVVGMGRLIGAVDTMIRESGNSAGFHAARWVAAWLERPAPALGGRTPGSLMRTAEGREIVLGLVEQMQSGAYA